MNASPSATNGDADVLKVPTKPLSSAAGIPMKVRTFAKKYRDESPKSPRRRRLG
jgi:hypothetical protein